MHVLAERWSRGSTRASAVAAACPASSRLRGGSQPFSSYKVTQEGLFGQLGAVWVGVGEIGKRFGAASPLQWRAGAGRCGEPQGTPKAPSA